MIAQRKRRHGGHITKRGLVQDRRIRASNRPRKKFKKGVGDQGDWDADENF